MGSALFCCNNHKIAFLVSPFCSLSFNILDYSENAEAHDLVVVYVLLLSRYTKALEVIKKLHKEQAQEIKTYKLKLENLQTLKDAAYKVTFLFPKLDNSADKICKLSSLGFLLFCYDLELEIHKIPDGYFLAFSQS